MRPPRALALICLPALLAACEAFVPLREPPPSPIQGLAPALTTRAEVIARFGPPDEVRVSDLGEVLVYRRIALAEINPNRYYGGEGRDRRDRYQALLVYLDQDGRVVRWSTQLE